MTPLVEKMGVYRLSLYEECVGVLFEVKEEEGLPIAKIGKISLAIPLEMEEKMRPHIGKRVSVLRTDIPNKSHLFRVVSNQEMKDESDLR